MFRRSLADGTRINRDENHDLKRGGSEGGKRAPVRFGRPPKELVGEVDMRILDVVAKVFLELGFQGASIDEIAEVACWQATLLPLPRQRALFTDVVKREILLASRSSRLRCRPVDNRGAPQECGDHPAALGFRQRQDRADAAGFSRSAPVPRSGGHSQPDGARAQHRTGVHLLGELTHSDELGSLPAFVPERLATTARFFLDLIAVPMLLRALFEMDLKTLDAEIDAHVARSVAFFPRPAGTAGLNCTNIGNAGSP